MSLRSSRAFRAGSVALLICAAACNEPTRYPAPDGGLPNGNGGSTGQGGSAAITAGQVISTNIIADWELEPHLAVAPDGRVFAVWIALDLGRRFVGYAISKDGGATFAQAQIVPADPSADAVDPSVTVDAQGIFHVAWLEMIAGGGRRVKAAAYIDEGDTFTIPVELSDPAGSGAAGEVWDKPWIVGFESGSLLVAWGTENGASISLSSSADGMSWSRTTFAPDGSLRNVAVPCTAGGDRVYLPYLVPGGVELARSDDAGATWSSPVRVEAAGESVAFEAPSCAAAGDDVWVLYGTSAEVVGASRTPLLDGIHVAYSHDAGATFTKRQTLGKGRTTLLPFLSRAPNGRLDVIYYGGHGYGDSQAEVFWARSGDGVSWEAPEAIHGPLILESERGKFGSLGDYVGVRSADDALYVTFTDNASGAGTTSHVRMARIGVP